MSTLPMKFTGWKAVAAVAVGLGIAIPSSIRWPRNELSAVLAKPILNYLQAEQTRRVMGTLAPNGPSKLTREGLKTTGDALASAQKVTIESIEVRGNLRTAIARVRYAVDSKTPPDGRDIRFLRLQNTFIGGWTVDCTTTALSFFLAW